MPDRLYGRTDGEHHAYLRGLADGNAAAVRTMIGCFCQMKLVVDPSIPEGFCELRVRDKSGIHAPLNYVNMLGGFHEPGE